MRIGILGGGSIGTRHLRNLKQLGFADICVVDPSKESRDRAEQCYGVTTLPTLSALYEFAPEMVVIASPSSLHFEQLGELLENTTAHILVEKPLSHRLQNIETLLALQREKGVAIMVGCNLRFHPGLIQLRTLLHSGAIGQALFATIEGGSYLPDWHPDSDYLKSYSALTRLGGGCLLDWIHEIDYSLWLFGPPETVSGSIIHSGTLGIETEDYAHTALSYRRQSSFTPHSATISVNYLQRPSRRQCTVVGTRGTLSWSMTEGSLSLYSTDTKEWTHTSVPADYSLDQMYIDEMRYFIECISNSTPNMSDLEEGMNAVRIVELAKQSHTLGLVLPYSPSNSTALGPTVGATL